MLRLGQESPALHGTLIPIDGSVWASIRLQQTIEELSEIPGEFYRSKEKKRINELLRMQWVNYRPDRDLDSNIAALVASDNAKSDKNTDSLKSSLRRMTDERDWYRDLAEVTSVLK